VQKKTSAEPTGSVPVDNSYSRLQVTKVKALPPSYEIRGMSGAKVGDVLAFAQRIPVVPFKKVNFYRDSSKAEPLWSFRADKPFLTKNRYQVVDLKDSLLGTFEKDYGKSFSNAKFTLETANGMKAFGADSQIMLNAMRLMMDFKGQVKYLFQDEMKNTVMTIDRGWKQADSYIVTMAKTKNGQVDWRLGACLGVALDTLLLTSVG